MSLYMTPVLIAGLLAWAFHAEIRAWWRRRKVKAPPAIRRGARGRR